MRIKDIILIKFYKDIGEWYLKNFKNLKNILAFHIEMCYVLYVAYS